MFCNSIWNDIALGLQIFKGWISNALTLFLWFYFRVNYRHIKPECYQLYVYFSRQNSHISYKFIINNYSICRFLLNPFLRLQFIPNFFGVCASVCTKNEYIWYSEVKKKIELTSLERHSAIFNIYYITRSFLLSSQRYFPLRNLLWDRKDFLVDT